MADYLRRSWAVVDLDRLSHNVRTLQAHLAPGCRMMGVVKADAYGHGDVYVARQLARLGVQWLGVSNIEEALSLRAHGIQLPILVLGMTPPERAELLCGHDLTQTVHSLEYALLLEASAARSGVELDVHIKVDTGMSRLGFVAHGAAAGDSVEQVAQACALPHLRAGGIFTHFAVADELGEASAAFTRGQFRAFMGALEALEARGLRFGLRHCCNSAGTINYPEMHLDMVRSGIALYGLDPSPDCAGRLALRPVMELYSTVTQVKLIQEGDTVSYGRCFTARRSTKIAAVAIGYADGYGRELSGKARVLVRGRFANVTGRVCMDQLLLDVTHIPGVEAGDVVTIVGRDGENSLSFDDMARLSGTINYEKVCLIGKRVPRVYRQDGGDVGVVDYVYQGL